MPQSDRLFNTLRESLPTRTLTPGSWKDSGKQQPQKPHYILVASYSNLLVEGDIYGSERI